MMSNTHNDNIKEYHYPDEYYLPGAKDFLKSLVPMIGRKDDSTAPLDTPKINKRQGNMSEYHSPDQYCDPTSTFSYEKDDTRIVEALSSRLSVVSLLSFGGWFHIIDADKDTSTTTSKSYDDDPHEEDLDVEDDCDDDMSFHTCEASLDDERLNHEFFSSRPNHPRFIATIERLRDEVRKAIDNVKSSTQHDQRLVALLERLSVKIRTALADASTVVQHFKAKDDSSNDDNNDKEDAIVENGD